MNVRLPLAALLCALAASAAHAAPAPAPKIPVLDASARDTTCAPCRDFYQHANGAWLRRTEVPPAYSAYGSFQQVDDRNQEILRSILEHAAAEPHPDPGTNAGRIGIYYGSCMDSAAADAAGADPVRPTLARVDAMKSTADIPALVAGLQLNGVRVLFGFSSVQDARNSEDVIAGASQGGLGLPERDFYLRPDSASQALRDAYVEHIARIFVLLGDTDAAAKAGARQVFAIEKSLAESCYPAVKRRDPEKNYHRMSLAAFQATTPDFSWDAYLAALHLAGVEELNVAQPEFFQGLDAQLKAVPLEEWKQYFRWKVAADAAPMLSDAFVQEDFQFTRRLSGARALQPRWKRCLRQTNAAMGEAVGEEFVKQHFSEASKARMLALVRNLEAALKARIERLPWMSDTTKAHALTKLAAIRNKIGYPDQWRDYSALNVEPGPFLANQYRAAEFGRRRELAKIGRPLDRDEWGFPPPTVNAYYSDGLNEVVFPAGILQPPFYNPDADDAVLYGGIGAVIGHELTHGFDNNGRKFDAKGNMTDWWTAADAANFMGRVQKIVNQFDAFEVAPGLHVNGRLTTGENIADLGGLNLALEAYHHTLEGKGEPPRVDGLTGDQRFFYSFAQIWREKIRPERIRTLVAADSHAPAEARIRGPLSNMPEFAKAFGCKAGDGMVAPDSLRVVIW